MKYKVVSLVSFIALVALTACSQSKSMSNNSSIKPLMTLSKSKCFGKCQVYKVKIYADQSISYEGIKFVDKIGLFQSIINDVDYKALVAQFVEIDFPALDSSYLTSASDPQKITLGYHEKEVIYQNRAASEALKAITKSIDAIVEKTVWNEK